MNYYIEIEDTENPGSYYTMRDGTCEYVNPIYHSYRTFIDMRLRYVMAINKIKEWAIHDEQRLKYKFLSEWHEHKSSLLNRKFPEGFIDIFGTNKKKIQIKLLAGSKLTIEDFEALLYQSWENYRFKFSKYIFQHDPKEFKDMEKPRVTFMKSETEVKKVGQTNMTDGQLKALIKKRNVVVANFFDKEEEWHCLFLTYKGIAGQEEEHITQPHMHYTSSAFGLTREELIKNFQRPRHKVDSVHILFEGYNPMAQSASEVQKANF